MYLIIHLCIATLLLTTFKQIAGLNTYLYVVLCLTVGWIIGSRALKEYMDDA